MGKLEGKIAIVTGSGKGIGRDAALAIAAEGATVVTVARTQSDLDETVKMIEDAGGTAISLSRDLTDGEQVADMVKTVVDKYGRIDILVNNAGISHIGLLEDMTIDEWNRIIGVNLTSVFSASKLALPHMIHQKSGKILNISSIWGNVGASCEVAYSACKGGINSFTKALAKELAPSNIQVNAIACGVIDTQMNACFSEEERAELADEIPAGRFGTPEETAHLAVQLATGNEYLTGQIITLDGGWL